MFESDVDCTTPGSYLRYHRKFQNFSTRELADKVSIVPAAVVLYENDRHDIPYNTAIAIAEVLGIDRSRLMVELYPHSAVPAVQHSGGNGPDPF